MPPPPPTLPYLAAAAWDSAAIAASQGMMYSAQPHYSRYLQRANYMMGNMMGNEARVQRQNSARLRRSHHLPNL